MQPLLSETHGYHRRPWYMSRKPWAIIAVVVAVLVIVLAVVLSEVLKGGPQTNHFLHIADLHYDSQNRTCTCNPVAKTCCDPKKPCNYTPFGKYGAVGCDSHWSLINETMYALSQLQTQPDYVVLCGDLSGHNSPSFEVTISEVKAVRQIVGETFPEKLVIGVIGNDDVNPDYCVNDTWYQALFPVWQESIQCSNCYKYDSNNVANWNLGGYYSLWPEKGLRVFALNTMYFAVQFDKACHPGPGNDTIGAQQLTWLQNGLQEALTAGDNVYIVGHVLVGQQVYENPPGTVLQTTLWTESYLVQYSAIVSQFSSIIRSQLYAHVHRDEFRLMRQNFTGANSPIVAPVLATSSVSPIFLNNPSFRIYSYETTYHNLLDYHVYFFDLEANNVGRANGYEFLYRFSTQWGSVTEGADGPALGAAAMDQLSYALDHSLLNMSAYRNLRNVMFFQDRYWWDCAIQYVDLGLYQQCMATRQGSLT